MNLGQSDKLHLGAAEGWLAVGDLQQANEELDRITPELRSHALVLRVRYGIYSTAKNWEVAAEIARAISEMQPGDWWGHVHLAYCLHELKRTIEARDVLLLVADLFPKNWLIYYNLACYCCRLGELNEAKKWLGCAIDVADKKDLRRMAMDDDDLQPLWREFGGI